MKKLQIIPDVISWPANSTYNLILDYQIHAHPDTPGFHTKYDCPLLTFRKKGGEMEYIYAVELTVTGYPDNMDLLQGALTDEQLTRLKSYVDKRNSSGFGFSYETPYIFYILKKYAVITEQFTIPGLQKHTYFRLSDIPHKVCDGQDQIVLKTRNDIEISTKDTNALSIDFEKITGNARKAVNIILQIVNIAEKLPELKGTEELIVQIPKAFLKDYKAGKILLNENSKNGVAWPTLYRLLDNGKREFVCNLPVKKDVVLKGDPFGSITQGYYNLALQAQLSELSDKIDKLFTEIKDVKTELEELSIADMQAGKNMILRSVLLKNSPSKNMDLSNARLSLTKAHEKFGLSLKRRIEQFTPIPKNQLKRILTELSSDQISDTDKEYNEIARLYSLYMATTQYLAYAYLIDGDSNAAETIFVQAESFLDSIDFSKIKTIRYIHKNEQESRFFYNTIEKNLSLRKEKCLEAPPNYEVIEIPMNKQFIKKVITHERKG